MSLIFYNVQREALLLQVAHFTAAPCDIRMINEIISTGKVSQAICMLNYTSLRIRLATIFEACVHIINPILGPQIVKPSTHPKWLRWGKVVMVS